MVADGLGGDKRRAIKGDTGFLAMPFTEVRRLRDKGQEGKGLGLGAGGVRRAESPAMWQF